MKYLHTMVRVTDVDASLRFYCEGLGLEEVRRRENEKGRFTLIFLAPPGQSDAQLELTWNWDPEEYTGGRNFGHLAYAVDDIYATCAHLQEMGVVINRPPRDGVLAFSLLKRLVERYPASPYAEDARQRMVFLKNRLAAYENTVARYYLDRGAYVAALNRAKGALEEYNGAESGDESLTIMIEAYEGLGMDELAADTRQVLQSNFPNES